MAKQKLVQKLTGTEIIEDKVTVPTEKRYAVIGKDAFHSFRPHRIECKSREDAEQQAVVWRKNGGQDIQMIVEEPRQGIVWVEVNREPFN